MAMGTYGLADTMNRPPRVGGPTVASTYAADTGAAMGMASSAAGMQTQRDIANSNQQQQAKAGNAKAGAAVGGAVGMIWGPVGAMVGSTLGGLIGGAF